MFRRISFRLFIANFAAAIIGAGLLRFITTPEPAMYVLYAACIFLILIGVANAIASHRIRMNLHHITELARDIQEGKLDTRIPVYHGDEMEVLTIEINTMVATLQTDILELKKLEQYRREFLGNVSHELRTPIFNIQGYIESLQRGAMHDPAVANKFLERAHSNVLRLNTLVNDLMEISQIESGEMRMSFRYFNIAPLIQQVAEELEPSAELKGLGIAIKLESNDATEIEVYADKERIKQVLVNLVDNAIKYTDQGTVTLSARKEHHKVTVTVADTGMGIPSEQQPRIFERFYRVDKDRSREAGGTGLGLAIVKHILERHNSKITVESELGKGSIFTFLLEG